MSDRVIDYGQHVTWPANAALVSDNVLRFTFKPAGRERHFDALRRGLARRLRLPFVRRTLWERDNPQAYLGTVTYGPMWTSNNALANYSFACVCHKRERYSRKSKHPKALCGCGEPLDHGAALGKEVKARHRRPAK